MRNKYLVFVSFVLLVLLWTGGMQALADGSTTPQAFVPNVHYNFAPVPAGAKILHVFIIKNKGNGLLHIERVKTG